MLAWLSGLNVELIAGGIVGLSMVGVVARNVIIGWAEARNKLKETEKSSVSLTTAMSISWDKDQIERAISAVERLAESHEVQLKYSEAIAKAQGILSDNFQQTTHMKLNELLERLDDMPQPNTRVTRPHRR